MRFASIVGESHGPMSTTANKWEIVMYEILGQSNCVLSLVLSLFNPMLHRSPPSSARCWLLPIIGSQGYAGNPHRTIQKSLVLARYRCRCRNWKILQCIFNACMPSVHHTISTIYIAGSSVFVCMVNTIDIYNTYTHNIWIIQSKLNDHFVSCYGVQLLDTTIRKTTIDYSNQNDTMHPTIAE